ncbi:MAG: FKBP-type peptidyl-prolyl cis-trans isomerase [Muribaculaceae bacterium]|nr:FKBP-type peptidyl-prolyl cis-trans isomerase [Muribaculaceae bacterium]
MDNVIIEPTKFVSLAYEIFTVSPSGETSVFKFTREHPDNFIMGMEPGMLDAFMQHISGMQAGEHFNFVLKPEEAFGEVNPELIIDIDKSVFHIDGKFDSDRVKVGAVVPMQTEEGHRMDGFVQAIGNDTVTVDFNHQLAGETIRYVGEVLEVRDATIEEINARYSHHCDCGCDHCGHDHDHDDNCGCDSCSGCKN